MPIPLAALGLRALLAAGEPILAAGGRLVGAVGRRVAADPLTGALVKGGVQVAEAAAPYARAAGATVANAGRAVAQGSRDFLGAARAGMAGAPRQWDDLSDVYHAGAATGEGLRGAGRNMAEGVRQVGKWADENPVKAGALQVASAVPLIHSALKSSKKQAAAVTQDTFQSLDPGTQQHVLATGVVGSRNYGHYTDYADEVGIPDPMRLSEREFLTLKQTPALLEQLRRQSEQQGQGQV